MIYQGNLETKSLELWQEFEKSAKADLVQQEDFWLSYQNLIIQSKQQKTAIVAPTTSLNTHQVASAQPFVFSVDAYKRSDYVWNEIQRIASKVLLPVGLMVFIMNVLLLIGDIELAGLIFLNFFGGAFCMAVFFYRFQRNLSVIRTFVEVSSKSLRRVGGGMVPRTIHFYDVVSIKQNEQGLVVTGYSPAYTQGGFYENIIIPSAFLHYDQARKLIEHYWESYKAKQAL